MTAHRLVLALALLALGVRATAAQDLSILQDPRFAQACQLHESGEEAAAEKQFLVLCNEKPNNGYHWVAVADFLVQRQDFQRSEPFARRGLPLVPDLQRAHTVLGTCLLFTDQVQEAEKVFREAVDRFPPSAVLFFNVGAACLSSFKNLEALRFIDQALELDPQNALYLVAAGDTCLNLRRYERATGHFRRALAASRPHADAGWKLAETCGFLEKDEEAAATFQRFLSIGPPAARLRTAYHYAVFLFERQQLAEALGLLEKVVAKKKNHRMAWLYLAKSQKRLGQEGAAKKSLARYRTLQRRADKEEEEYLLGLLAGTLGQGAGSADDSSNQDSGEPER